MLSNYRKYLPGYLFILPAVILIGTFGIFPMFYTIFVSLHKWRIRKSRFLGFDNYFEAIGPFWIVLLIVAVVALLIFASKFRSKHSGLYGDSRKKALSWLLTLAGAVGLFLIFGLIWVNGDDGMVDSLRVTMWYSLGTVPTQLISGLILAVLLDRKFRGKQVFRVVYLLPYIVPSIASAAVFERMFSLRTESLANTIVTSMGGEPLQWLQEPKGIFEMMLNMQVGAAEGLAGFFETWMTGPSLALVTVMIFNWWVFTGYYALIYANGLSQIPRHLYEAAEIDGASGWAVFRHIMVPLVSPVTFFLTMLGVIGTFKAFNHIFVLRTPAARNAIDTMSIHIFFTFFRRSRFGYAAALSLILLLIVIGLTIIQRKIMSDRSGNES